jgi:hypothetical protein
MMLMNLSVMTIVGRILQQQQNEKHLPKELPQKTLRAPAAEVEEEVEAEEVLRRQR